MGEIQLVGLGLFEPLPPQSAAVLIESRQSSNHPKTQPFLTGITDNLMTPPTHSPTLPTPVRGLLQGHYHNRPLHDRLATSRLCRSRPGGSQIFKIAAMCAGATGCWREMCLSKHITHKTQKKMQNKTQKYIGASPSSRLQKTMQTKTQHQGHTRN